MGGKPGKPCHLPVRDPQIDGPQADTTQAIAGRQCPCAQAQQVTTKRKERDATLLASSPCANNMRTMQWIRPKWLYMFSAGVEVCVHSSTSGAMDNVFALCTSVSLVPGAATLSRARSTTRISHPSDRRVQAVGNGGYATRGLRIVITHKPLL